MKYKKRRMVIINLSARHSLCQSITKKIPQPHYKLSNLTFHEKDGAQHEFRPLAEYLYNALPFFFPKK
ncbi:MULTISPECIES: hypothetical protein [Butyricimonas]|uniref:hypothetical protein n=1 Tax=Butyricimonas TaxID=574697 RepID=UPI0011DD5238|nr:MULTISPECIES: hypothetical protein [Butyricimonas]